MIGWEGKREAGGSSGYHVGLLPSTMNMNMRYQGRIVIHKRIDLPSQAWALGPWQELDRVQAQGPKGTVML